MKKHLTIAIPTPCHEKWSKFTPTEKGRFCGSCQKEVIDFTTWNEEQIKQYFLTRPSNACGRFAPHQLTTYTYHRQLKKSSSPAVSSLAFLLMMLTRPAEAQPSSSEIKQEQVLRMGTESVHRTDTLTQIIIKGIVTDTYGDTLPGVTITRRGTSDSTVTNADGKYEMTIHQPKSTDTLVFEFIGLLTEERTIATDRAVSEMSVTMSFDNLQLCGIVVGGIVAYRWYSPRGIWWKIKGIFRR